MTRIVWVQYLTKVVHIPALAPSQHFGGEDAHIFGASVAANPQKRCLTESGLQKFVQEGHAFFGSRYSSKPVGFVGEFLRWQRLAQNQFGCKQDPLGFYDPGKFMKDLGTILVEVKNTVDEGHVNRRIR